MRNIHRLLSSAHRFLASKPGRITAVALLALVLVGFLGWEVLVVHSLFGFAVEPAVRSLITGASE